MKRIQGFLSAAAFIAYMMTGCEMPLLAGGSSSTETGEPIQITGRVVGNSGEALSGVVVRLKANGAADTTDAAGRYLILGSDREAVTPSDHALDTLLYIRAGQRVTAVSITNWIDTLPDIGIIQRGFLGYLHAHGKTVGRVEGVLTGDDVPPGDSVVATFYYNALSANYSGFLYFPAPGDSVRTYQVLVKVYSENGTLLGTSPSVGFTSQAGNILIPDTDL